MAVKMIWKNVTLEIPDDDPRLAVIQMLLFGQSPLAALGPAPTSDTPPRTNALPAVAVPEGFREFWKHIGWSAQQELAFLADGPRTVDFLAWELRLTGSRGVQGLHRTLRYYARKNRVGEIVRMSGWKAQNRKAVLAQEKHVPWIKALAAEKAK